MVLLLEGNFNLKTDGYNQGGYEWFHNAWGTKWGICNPRITVEKDNCITYSFETAWSPCENAIKKMSKENPKLELEYYCDEESGDFRFNQIWKNGELESEEDLQYEVEQERKEYEEEQKEFEEMEKKKKKTKKEKKK